MRFINHIDIQNWAASYDAKGKLPILVSRLVRVTTPLSTFSEFPSGTAAFVGGWDGVVKCETNTSYVPEGISLWEFGTESGVKGKADSDYNKRIKDPLGYNPQECTFIFLTPKLWSAKEKWKKSKLIEGIWKDVKVYDSRNIEEWLDTAMAVSRWFSSYLKKYPLDGIQTPEEFWEEWSIGPRCKIVPEIVTAGREKEMQEILIFLKSTPGIKAIRASTKKEAIAFIIAAANQFELIESERFFSKSLVVDTEANYRGIRINTLTPLNLIPRFEETQPLFAAVSDGHHVLVPLGADDSFNQDTIILPTNNRDGQVEGLTKSGITKENAEKFSREAGRNITILKKLLGFPENRAKWLKGENIREIIPALLLGRWNDNNKGDKEILEKLSGENPEDYLEKLQTWPSVEESPLIQIGTTWRLTSPLDAWTNLSSLLIKKDFSNLEESFLFAFKNGNPNIDSNQNGLKIQTYFSKEKIFSSWAREGLVQSLILIAIYGDKLKIPNIPSSQTWVENLINKLLNKASGQLWISLNHELPFIAEASPNIFIKAVNESLSEQDKPIMEMFIEEESLMGKTSNHTGLLWALEGLAWIPEYLYDASLILAKLASLDPGGQLANRPKNSLSEIFKPWHYQTLANFEERMNVLKEISKREKEVAWDLLIQMLPEFHGIAHPTFKLRWRMFNENRNIIYTHKERWEIHSYVVELLISIFDFSEEKFSQLIKNSVRLNPEVRIKLFKYLESNISKINQVQYSGWNTLREILSRHRSNPKTDWALPENELIYYQKLYNQLEPIDVISMYSWLFNEHFPHFPEGIKYEEDTRYKYKQQQEKIDSKRIEGLKKILDKYGIEKIKEISRLVKQPSFLGDTLAKILNDESKIFPLLELLNGDKNVLNFIHSFIIRKVHEEKLDWVFSFYKILKENKFNNKALAQLFVPLPQSAALWDFINQTNIEIKNEYWLSMYPDFHDLGKEDKILGINYLLEYQRFYSVIDICSLLADEIPTNIIIIALQKLATEKANEPTKIVGYEIENIFTTLDKRNDVEHKILMQLEWYYLPLLASYGTSRNPKILHDELARSPEFFVEVLRWIYKPKGNGLVNEEKEDISVEIIQNRANYAYELLYSWTKIPGVNEDGNINKTFLNYWVDKARILANEVKRLEVADSHIGQVLAQYPEENLFWPPDEICETIERINTDSIKNNFAVAIFNKRGASARGTFDGGDIERGYAEYFQKLSSNRKTKYPIIAEILLRIAKDYLEDAKLMDQRAERDCLEN